MPIILKYKNNYIIMSGNTRMDIAYILNIKVKIIILDIDNFLEKG